MYKIISLSLTFLFSYSAFANDFSKVDQFIGNPSFEDSFQLGDSAIQVNKSCVSSRICSEFDLKVDVIELGELQAKLRYKTSGTSTPQINEYLLEDWNIDRGNMLRRLFRVIESFGQRPEISDMQTEEYTLPNGELTEAFRVYFDVIDGRNRVISKNQAVLVREFPGATQLAIYIKNQLVPFDAVDQNTIIDVNRLL